MTARRARALITPAALVAAAAVALAVAGPLAAQSDPEPAPAPETWDDRVASLNCEAWQVPGWLDEDGLPTSCVNNEAVPGSHKGEPPATPTEAPTATETPTQPAPEAATQAAPDPAPVPASETSEGCTE